MYASNAGYPRLPKIELGTIGVADTGILTARRVEHNANTSDLLIMIVNLQATVLEMKTQKEKRDNRLKRIGKKTKQLEELVRAIESDVGAAKGSSEEMSGELEGVMKKLQDVVASVNDARTESTNAFARLEARLQSIEQQTRAAGLTLEDVHSTTQRIETSSTRVEQSTEIAIAAAQHVDVGTERLLAASNQNVICLNELRAISEHHGGKIAEEVQRAIDILMLQYSVLLENR